jgi:hypothetical protein
MAEIKYEIIKHISVLSESAKGWKKEFNLISWNDRKPKYNMHCIDPLASIDKSAQVTYRSNFI